MIASEISRRDFFVGLPVGMYVANHHDGATAAQSVRCSECQFATRERLDADGAALLFCGSHKTKTPGALCVGYMHVGAAGCIHFSPVAR
jgi:hypothetical protein